MSSVLENITSIEVLRLEPGDALVLTMNQHVTPEMAKRIEEHFNKAWDGKFKDVKLIVLDNGASMKVLRRTE